MNSIADFVILSFSQILEEVKVDEIKRVGVDVPIPFFDDITLKVLLRDSEQSFRQQPTLLRVSGNVTVVGDLHGSFHDLIRIILTCGSPKTTKYLFLGDYVDRGAFSIEVIVLLLALHLKYPQNILMLRGNHETPDTTEQYGFKDDLLTLYPTNNFNIYQIFLSTFACMPLACLINKNVFCVHGGISSHLKTVEQIDLIQRPIMNDHSPLIKDLLWADPCKGCHFYAESYRGGSGRAFGTDALHLFLTENNLSLLIRAHQYNKQGVKVSMAGVITVFSASSYQFDGSNKSGVLFISDTNPPMMQNMDPINRMNREDATFFTMKFQGNSIARSQSVTLSVFTKQCEKLIVGRAGKRQFGACFGSIPYSKSIGSNLAVGSTFVDTDDDSE